VSPWVIFGRSAHIAKVERWSGPTHRLGQNLNAGDPSWRCLVAVAAQQDFAHGFTGLVVVSAEPRRGRPNWPGEPHRQGTLQAGSGAE